MEILMAILCDIIFLVIALSFVALIVYGTPKPFKDELVLFDDIFYRNPYNESIINSVKLSDVYIAPIPVYLSFFFEYNVNTENSSYLVWRFTKLSRKIDKLYKNSISWDEYRKTLVP